MNTQYNHTYNEEHNMKIHEEYLPTEQVTTEQAAELNVDMPVSTVVSGARTRLRPIFTGFEDHHIDVQEASQLTRNFRMREGKGAVKGQYFSRAAIEQMLAQEDVVGLRYYYTRNTEGKLGLVLVGVKEDGEDLVNGFISGNAIPTSPFCTEKNPLNS
jgi:hypothetical protein